MDGFAKLVRLGLGWVAKEPQANQRGLTLLSAIFYTNNEEINYVHI